MRTEVFVNIIVVVLIMYVICVVDWVILLFIVRMLNVSLVVRRVTSLDTAPYIDHIVYIVLSRNKVGLSNDNGHSNEGKCSAIRFTKNAPGGDNTLKQRILVDVIYTDFVVE